MNEAQPIPYGYCQCGCGREAPGVLYLTGHQGRIQSARDDHKLLWARAGIDYGLCLCGCGSPTSIAGGTARHRHLLMGEPVRFVLGHHQRKSLIEYLEEDRGYETPCWIWQRGLNEHGYGTVTGGLAHRAVYERRHGSLDRTLDLDHLCRVPPCVNPDHLEPVTHTENVRRGMATTLTAEAVALIRSVPESAQSLAIKFGVSRAAIYDVRSGRTWKDI